MQPLYFCTWKSTISNNLWPEINLRLLLPSTLWPVVSLFENFPRARRASVTYLSSERKFFAFTLRRLPLLKIRQTRFFRVLSIFFHSSVKLRFSGAAKLIPQSQEIIVGNVWNRRISYWGICFSASRFCYPISLIRLRGTAARSRSAALNRSLTLVPKRS